TVRQDEIACSAPHSDIVVGFACQVGVGSLNVVLGVLLDPRAIRSGVVRNEIEHQLQATLPQSVAEACKRRVSTEVLMDGVVGDGESGSCDVLLPEIRQGRLELLSPCRIAA